MVAGRALCKLAKGPVRPLVGYRVRWTTHDIEDSSLPARPAGVRGHDLSTLRDIQLSIYRGRLGSDASYTKVISQEVCELLSRTSLDRHTVDVIAKILRSFGFNQPYNQEFFDLISGALLKTTDESVFNALLPSFLWVCARCKHYPKPLLSRAGAYLLDNLHQFNSQDLNMMVHAFAVFNHRVPGLVHAVEKWFFANEVLSCGNHLPWSLAWAGMVFSEYPREMLKAVLKDNYIEGCRQMNRDFLLVILLQLRISLNLECADLKLGLGWDTKRDMEQWGRCRSAMKGVSAKVIRMAYLDKLRSYKTMKRSVFGSNLHRAIRTALGGSTFVQSDAISLSGYLVDFEVLLDEWGNPIECPIRWKYRALDLLASSLGMKSEGEARRGRLQTISDDLLQAMKTSEKTQDSPVDPVEVVAPPITERYDFEVPFNLASDWGRKFCGPPRRPARKLVIEGDGIFHFARNDRTAVVGSTVLKKRHLEALGWETITVDYKVWHELSSGDAQADYVRSLINPSGTPSPNQ